MSDFTLEDLRAVLRHQGSAAPATAANSTPRLTARLLAFGASLERAVREGRKVVDDEGSGTVQWARPPSPGSEGPPGVRSSSDAADPRSPHSERSSGSMPPLHVSLPDSGAASPLAPAMPHDAAGPPAAHAAALEQQLAEVREAQAAEAAAARSNTLSLMERCAQLAGEAEAAQHAAAVCERQLEAAEAVRLAAIQQLAEERQCWAEREWELLERRRQLEAAARHAVGVLEARVQHLEALSKAGSSGSTAQVG